jgi:twinkle protein
MSKLKILGDTSCPACVSRGRDSTGNHLLLFENEDGEKFAKCTRCNHYVPPDKFDPKSVKSRVKKELTDADIQRVVEEFEQCPIKKLEDRGIPEYVCERFGIRTLLSETDGQTIKGIAFPRTKQGVTQGFKVKNLDPRYFFSVGSNRDSDLFGYPQILRGDSYRKKLFLTEGEIDALSVYHILDKYKSNAMKQRQMAPSVLGLADGAGSAVAAMSRNVDLINEFEEVILCFDSDEAGRSAVREVLKVFPNIKSVSLPMKDANEMLMAGKEKELYNLLLGRAEAPKVEGLTTVLECLEEALQKPTMGFSYPWQGLTDLTYGQRLGEIIAVGGGVGIGKTALAHQIAAWNWKEHKQKSLMVMLEENNGDTVKNVASKVDNVAYHRPDLDFNVAQLTKTATEMNDYVYLWKSNINQNIRFNFDSIVQAIRYHAVVNGVDHVFFDNITAATQHLSPTEINTEVGRIAMTLAGLADELDIQIFIFSHLNTPSGGASHENGGAVREHQFTGSRALMRWSQQLLGFQRDKQAEGDSKHLSEIVLLKNRKFGTTGTVDTVYNPTTNGITQREEVTDEEY